LVNIVAIHNLPEEKEMLAKTLAAAMKSTVYEALSRLKSPGRGPFVVSASAATGQAEALITRLRTCGFDAVLLKGDEVESETARFVVRKFRLNPGALIVESRPEESLGVDYGSIRLLLRGTSIAQTTLTETVKEKKFNPGMALVTGGLKMTKTSEKTLESTTQTREGFCHLYAEGQPTLVFREGVLVYDSLGAALHPTRQANFSYLITELRRLSPKAFYDDRLLSRAGQVQLLGPMLSPEKHLDIATSLLAKLIA
jgi:hypothetical protein